MSQAATPLRVTFAEYLRLEEMSEVRHEFVDGQIFAMAGGTPEHALIAANVIGEIRSRITPGPCRVYTADLRVRVAATGLTTYPDVTVICGPLERDPNDPNTVTNPTIIVEILSDSTEVYDRNEKFSNYRRIPSLRSYVLVSQHEARVEVYQRGADGRWTLDEARVPEAARIDALDCSLPVSAVYSGVFG